MLWTDLTLLKPEATPAEIDQLADRARAAHAAAVCVNAGVVDRVAARLIGSTTRPISVVGFPLGAGRRESLAAETRDAVAAGAREIDMVIAVGRLRGGDHRYVFDHVAACVAAAGVPVKAILETCYLADLEIAQASLIAAAAGAAFVKTSTGFGSAGATERHVALMRRTVGPEIGVKASGGIRSRAQAHAMLRAGANRIGASRIDADPSATRGY
ncbi:MAG: deoxyribose-phosphate aldolase [Alphaproteobacteria bacterium]|nr:deoxyribose-phosphate aldolase [Alphaproteobacteria bacterium]